MYKYYVLFICLNNYTSFYFVKIDINFYIYICGLCFTLTDLGI